MTENEAKGFIQGKLDCMDKCNVFEREHSYNTDLCDNCDYCYSQGTFGEQKEAFSMAIKALEKLKKIKEVFTHYDFYVCELNVNDYISALSEIVAILKE